VDGQADVDPGVHVRLPSHCAPASACPASNIGPQLRRPVAPKTP
jgi:hypothetical protein